MGENILILAFVVIIIGGIGSIRGAFVAAIIVGLIDTIGRAFLPDVLHLVVEQRAPRRRSAPLCRQMLIYILMAAILVFRPAGLFRQRADERVARFTARRRTGGRADRAHRFAAVLLALLALVPVYALATGDTFGWRCSPASSSSPIAAVSLNMIMGYGGMVSFGHAAYLGIGGYAVGILRRDGIGSGYAVAGRRRGVGALRAAGRRTQSCARAASISS